MTSMTTRAAARPHPAPQLNWRIIAGLTGAAAGATVVAGAFLPWVTIFAGLVKIPGVHGGNGRMMAAAGALLAAAGLYHAIRGGGRSRWLVGVGGFAALGFSGYLLIQLAATTRSLGGSSMVLAGGGPGLWVTAAGSLAAFGTLFLPSPAAGPAERSPVLSAGAGAIWRGVAARTADLDSRGARRGLQVALGVVWLLDAALQLQPYMFGRAFVGMVLEPASMGNPAVIASPAMWADRLISHDVAAWNTAFALIQLAIAAGLLWRPAVKAALAGSVLWSLAIWWLGEGLGGVLTGTASPVTGAPGAVILYALIAVLLWPRVCRGAAPATGGLAAGRWGKAAWLVLWGSFAYLILQPAVRAPRGLHDALAAQATGEPGWLAALDRAAAAAAGSRGLVISVVLAVVFVVIAAGIFFPATVRPALILAGVAGLTFWVAGQNFGAVLTGRVTDPNTGLLLVLLTAAYWPVRTAPPAPGTQQAVLATSGQRAGGW